MKQVLKCLAVLGIFLATLAKPTLTHADTINYQAQTGQGMDRWFGSVYNQTSQYDWRLRVGGWGDEYDTMLRFNLSSLPQVANRAIIWLYMYPDGAGYTSIEWYLNTSQWQSPTISWFNQPNGISYGTTPAPTTGGWYGVDVTYFYNQWRKADNQSMPNYGFKLRPWPRLPNNRYSSSYSSNVSGAGPVMQVSYTPQWDDYKLKLKWPLPGTKPPTPVCPQAFKCDWGPGKKKCIGQPMKHAGDDFPNPVGTPVYAAEDGVVKQKTDGGGDAFALTIEHTNLQGGKYTTVYWHINPLVSVGDFVPKGFQIATVASITSSGSHLHFGIRLGAYVYDVSDKGALPKYYCSELPTFPEQFIDPWDTNQVLFQ